MTPIIFKKNVNDLKNKIKIGRLLTKLIEWTDKTILLTSRSSILISLALLVKLELRKRSVFLYVMEKEETINRKMKLNISISNFYESFL